MWKAQAFDAVKALVAESGRDAPGRSDKAFRCVVRSDLAGTHKWPSDVKRGGGVLCRA